MKKTIISVVILFAAIFFATSFSLKSEAKNNLPLNFQEWMPCSVNDPTGTPLNVRTKANGRIITTLRNGALVYIDDRTALQKWARISFTKGRKKYVGYVLRDYLACQ